MASLEDRLKDNEYKLWVKAGICLGMFKTGLEKFAEERSIRLHGFVIDKVKLVTPVLKTICPTVKITKKRGGKWTTGCCTDCQIYADALVGFQCAPFELRQSNWTNSDCRMWPKEPWEMAKVYMNPGQKPFNQQPSPRETDLSGLINFIDHCVVPRLDIQDRNKLIQVRETRNNVMHSASMKLTQNEFDQHTDAMIKLLEDPLVLQRTNEAQNAAKEIRRVQMVHFYISTKAEFEVLRNKTTEIEAQGEHLREELEHLKDKQERLESSTEEKMNSIRGLVERESNERENAIAALKEDICQKETRMKELVSKNSKQELSHDSVARLLRASRYKLTTDLLKVKELMLKDKALYRKLDTRVTKVENTLEKTNVEFKVIQQSHETLMQQVRKIQSDICAGIVVNWHTDADVQQPKENISKLQEELKKLREQVEAKDKENEELKMEISSLKKQLATAKDQQTSETTQYGTEGLETVADLQNALERMDKKAAEDKKEYECKIEQLEYQNNKLRNESDVERIQELEENFADLESDHNRLRLELEAKSSYLKTHNDLYQQEKESNKALTSDIKRLESDIIALEAVKDREQKQFEMEIKNIISTKEEVENTLKHLIALEAVKDREQKQFEMEIKNIISTKEELENTLKHLTRECEVRRKTEKDLQIQQEQRTSDLHEEREKNIQLEKTIEQLKHDITKQKEDSEYTSRELLDTIANQKKELDKQNQNLDRQKPELDRQKQNLDRQKQDIDQKKQDVDRQMQELDRQTQELDPQKQKLNQQKQELDAQKQDVDRQKLELYRQKQELDAQKQDFDRQKQESDRHKQELNAQKQELDQTKQESDRQMQKLDARAQDLDAEMQDLDAQKQAFNAQKQALDAQMQDLDAKKQALIRQEQKIDAQKQVLDRPKQELYTQVEQLPKEVSKEHDAITREVDTKLSDDRRDSWVSGAIFLSGGELVVCDNNNSKIKLLSSSFDNIRSLVLHGPPWDVSEVDDNNVVVTLPFEKEIQYIQVLPTLQVTRVLKLDRMCAGIDMVKDDMYVTYGRPRLAGEEGGGRNGVMILDRVGNVKREIDVKTDLSLLNYTYLLVAESGRIYISNYATDSVTCIDSQGQILHQYKDPDLQYPRGVCFDGKGQVIICGSGSDNLHIMTSDGSKVKTMSTAGGPLAVAFRKSDRILIIGFWGNNKLMVLYNFTS